VRPTAGYSEPTLRGEIELVLQEQSEMTLMDLAAWTDAEIPAVVREVKRLRAEGYVSLAKQWPYGRTLVHWN
jgi:predicted ArsR family transcriptional regulator